jgi:4,5-dihydroxyphthalate decarboxylase
MELTIALERYERHIPFFDGTVKPPTGLTLKTLQVGQSAVARDGTSRHERMLNGEFDIAEFSMSTYLMVVDRKQPFVGVPIFPRRLFSSGLFYVRDDSSITKPSDLIGKRVATYAFQTTLALLAKGDLKFEYDVPWEEIHWMLQHEEKIQFTPKAGVRLDYLPKGSDVGHLLRDGVVDAVVQPHPPHSITSGEVQARRLFPDVETEELRYFKKYGYFPIMHIIVIRKDLIEQEPALPLTVMEMFSQAKEISNRYYSDPNWSNLAWGRRYYEREKSLLGRDIWPIGLAANRANLERFMTYSRDQGLIANTITVEDLFAPSTHTT